MERWRGKTALVTGASAGIGYAIAGSLAEAGINVVACARNPAAIEGLSQILPAKSGRLIGKTTDLVNETDILNLFRDIEAEFGHVDILINNAGGGALGTLSNGKTESWRHMLDLNILSTTICARETLKLLEKADVNEGHIININSVAGHSTAGIPGISFYAGTKHMITALTKSLHTELVQKKSRIRVTSLSPGLVNSRSVERAREKGLLADLTDVRALEGKDISDAVLYILGAPSHVVVTELTIAPLGQAI